MIKLYDIDWESKTAGPSNFKDERIELFFYGCKKAANGNPCKNCFNKDLWDSSGCIKEHRIEEIVDNIKKYSLGNKNVTIGGGEPTDQLEDLVILCKELKKNGFHIFVYTWRTKKDFDKKDMYKQLLEYADMVIGGEFIQSRKSYKIESNRSIERFIGSDNQEIYIDNNTFIKKDIEDIIIDKNYDIIIERRNDD